MSWQKCPVCNGSGTQFPPTWSGNTAELCSVCKGSKLIHDVTGRPPYSLETTSGKIIFDDLMKPTKGHGGE